MAQTQGLPPRPNLEHLKKQAKDRLKKLRASNSAAKLADAQVAIAREYGFASWKKLSAFVIANSSDGAELIRAATAGELETVRKLLDRSPKLISSRGERGMTALHAAVCAQFKPLMKEHEKIVELLIDRGADLEALAEEGNIGRCTPLHLACFSGRDRAAVVRRLLSAGAKVNVTSSEGDTPLSLATRHQETEIAKSLLDAGATLTLHDAVALDMTDSVKEMLDRDPALIKQLDQSWGYTAVSCAQTQSMKEMLLARGAQPGIHESSFAGLTDRVAKLLDANPALIHEREPRGRQPLHAAIAGNQLETVKRLVERGADLNAEWIEGWTPLVLAQRRAGPDVIEVIRQGLNPTAAIDFDSFARLALRSMDRAWAESCAIIEQRFDSPGSAARWEAAGIESPSLREREADEYIIRNKQMGQYRMISVWHRARVDSARSFALDQSVQPTRSLEFLRSGKSGLFEGVWRRIDWKPTHQGFSGKPARWDDLTEALTYLRNDAPAGEYRIITIRRMLLAQQLKDRIKIDKKHANLPTLERVEKSVVAAKNQWSVEALPERRKSHKIVQWKPIMDAAFCGDFRRVKILLDAGADPNAVSTTPQKYRPLHRAIEHKKTMPKVVGNEHVVKVLLEHGADPKLRATWDRITALQLAAIGEPRFIPLLRDRFEPLDIFHASVLGNAERISHLLKNDPSLAKSLDENNWTALHYCAASILHRDNPKQADALVRIAKMLLKAGADPMASWEWNDQWPLRPMFYACGRSNNPAIARLFFEAGADPCDGESVYHASDEGHAECLAVIEELTDPKKLAKECTKCLNMQLHWGHTRGTKWLLEHGADPDWIHPQRKMSALDEAIKNKRNKKIIELLRNCSKSLKSPPGRRESRARRKVRRDRG